MRALRVPSAGTTIVGLDHVQIAAPPGCEGDARRFYGWGNRLELMAGR